jgi:carbamoyltransferase
MMNIFGLNYGVHNSAVCLIKDGVLVAAAEEERFNRKKHYGGFPICAFKWCLQQAGLDIKDIEHVAFFLKPPFGITEVGWYHLKNLPASLGRFTTKKSHGGNLKMVLEFAALKSKLNKELGFTGKVHYVDHHVCHAASTFLVSPFDNAAILTLDSVGEWTTTTYAYGEGTTIKQLKRLTYPDSMGQAYAAVTQYLGFKPLSDEYKVMGMSAYGKPTRVKEFREIVSVDDDGNLRLDNSYFKSHYWSDQRYSQKMVERFGPPRPMEDEDNVTEEYADIACSFQRAFEDAALSMVRYLKRVTKSQNLCIAGGVGLNSVMNGRILSEGIFKNVYINPTPHDPGTSLGAAYYVYNCQLGQPRKYIFDSPFLGPGHPESEIVATLERRGVKYEKPKDIYKAAAQLIADGKVIGWYQDRMEWGPRALGNRSILADPRRAEMKDIVNRKIKFREPFRPFAPSVLEESIHDYFESPVNSLSYMIFVVPVKEQAKSVVPAITHVDGSARVHTVKKEVNPKYWQVIKEFGNITGVNCVLNTSFNVKGEPIVNTPEEAFNCYYNTGLDALVMGDYLVQKEASK